MTVLNEERYVGAAIQSVLNQDYPLPVQLCIALGPSSDETNKVISRFLSNNENFRVVSNPTGGRSSGLNAAIRATSGDVIVRVDARSLLPSDYIRRAVRTMMRVGAVNVGGIQRAVGDSRFSEAVAVALSSTFGNGGARYRSSGQDGPTDTVFLGVFSRKALESVGLFDERLVGNEDYELNVRLRESGGTVWLDSSLSVDYVPRASYRSLARQYLNYGAWKRRVTLMHPRSLRVRQLIPPIVTLVLLVSLTIAMWQPLALLAPLAYVLSTLIASILAAPRGLYILRVMIAFQVIHLSWGVGYLIGRGRSRR